MSCVRSCLASGELRLFYGGGGTGCEPLHSRINRTCHDPREDNEKDRCWGVSMNRSVQVVQHQLVCSPMKRFTRLVP